MIRTGLAVALLCPALTGVHAQVRSSDTSKNPFAVKPARPKPPKPISKEFSMGLRLNTDGFGIFADFGKVKSEETKYADQFYDVRLWQIDLSMHRHPKEVRGTYEEQGAGASGAKPFVFGKVNSFYAFKIGYGHRKLIAGKPEPGNVSIHWTYVGGLALGMLKPYYIEAYTRNANGSVELKEIKYEESTKEFFLGNPYNIVGGVGFAKGLGEMQYLPGIHARTSLHFDFAPSRKSVMAIEAGVAGAIYSKKIDLMANQKAYPYTFNLFASFQFGKRS